MHMEQWGRKSPPPLDRQMSVLQGRGLWKPKTHKSILLLLNITLASTHSFLLSSWELRRAMFEMFLKLHVLLWAQISFIFYLAIVLVFLLLFKVSLFVHYKYFIIQILWETHFPLLYLPYLLLRCYLHKLSPVTPSAPKYFTCADYMLKFYKVISHRVCSNSDESVRNCYLICVLDFWTILKPKYKTLRKCKLIHNLFYL